jgi:hypothetical protein
VTQWRLVCLGLLCFAAIIAGALFACDSFSLGKSRTAPPIQTPPIKEEPKSTDITAPVITGVSTLAVGKTGAVIIWTTNEAATSQVVYGLTTLYGSATAQDTNFVTSHTVTLGGLIAGTSYNFKVKSKDANGNESVSQDYTLVTSKAGTLVGGIISQNTTWTAGDSPYLITGTIQVPAGVTLTIEPGVSASMSSSGDYMFIVHGTVLAHGTPGNKITLDGGMHSFFSSENAGPEASVDLDYCEIKNGASLINFARCFYLGHSQVTNLTEYSDISFGPSKDVYIEYNKFTNASGFSTGGGSNVYIRYNYFNTRNRTVQDIPWIINKASPATVVNNNFFINTDGIALMLQSGRGTEGMVAANNYWGTQNITVIDAMIWDKNDDINLASYIEYLPIRTSPEPVRLFNF